MTAPQVQGWCPGALQPMLSGDGWVVRIRPPLGRLSRQAMAGIAELSLRHGNGWLDLSSRANLQLRGVREDALGALTAGLEALSLLDADVAAERRRNILLTPFAQHGDVSTAIARDLQEQLQSMDAPDLPAKFGFAVDAGSRPVLGATAADISIERSLNGTLICRADGCATGARVTPETAADVALELARWFLASGGAPAGRGRMAALLARGVLLPAAFGGAARDDHDFTPQPGRTPQGFMVALAFGQMRAETLADLAQYAAVRLTPWRMLLLEGLAEAPPGASLITSPDDPLLRIIACTGNPGCTQAHQPTRALARALAAHAAGRVHISGCAKGCAHPASAPITLVGTPMGFDLIRNGRCTDAPTISGLAPDPAVISKHLA